MVGVMMIDLSAAFDMVDHKILLQKLQLFGLDEQALRWVRSYLGERFQSVCVDGCMSPPLPVAYGVPQGSILGPLFYVLFTCDIPDLVHDHPVDQQTALTHCPQCGSTVCYVDDCTYSYAAKDPALLSRTLSDQYKRISDYMASNRLVINDDKTHLVVLGTRATAVRRDEVILQAGNHLVRPSRSEKLLGGIISDDLKWKKHLFEGDQSLVKQLTNRINGLVKVSQNATKATRLMVANGIFVSKLCYLIQVWGGCDSYLLDRLQVLQNRAARVVTGKSWFTSTGRLLKECKWLSIRQLVFYQTVLGVHKIMRARKPEYLSKKFGADHPCRTRQSTSGCIRLGDEFNAKSSLSHTSLCYNRIPSTIRQDTTFETFKYKLKKWIPID